MKVNVFQIKQLKECADQEECSQFSRVLVDMNPKDTYDFLLAVSFPSSTRKKQRIKALQMGFIELKHWFLLTSMDLKTMEMNLFRHNHARFIAVDVVSPEFLRTERNFDFNEFKRQITANWTFENEDTKALKMSEAVLTFDAVYLAAHSIYNISQEYPLKTDLHTTRCRTSTRGYIPYRYGRKIIEQVKNNVSRQPSLV